MYNELTNEELIEWLEDMYRRTNSGTGLDWDERQLLHELKEEVAWRERTTKEAGL